MDDLRVECTYGRQREMKRAAATCAVLICLSVLVMVLYVSARSFSGDGYLLAVRECERMARTDDQRNLCGAVGVGLRVHYGRSHP